MLNRINATNIRGDVFGGLTAAVIALPMALAFGIAVGNASGAPEVGAAAGLWGAVIIGLVASLFGGTPTLISEPTGPMTVVFTSVVISFASTAESPEKALAMAFTVGVLAGIFQILFGLFRLGRYITMMPYTVISGFMSGIGISSSCCGFLVRIQRWCDRHAQSVASADPGDAADGAAAGGDHVGHPLVHPVRPEEVLPSPVAGACGGNTVGYHGFPGSRPAHDP